MSRVKPEENATTSCRQKDSRVSIFVYERLLCVQILKLKQFFYFCTLRCKTIILPAAIFDNSASCNFVLQI